MLHCSASSPKTSDLALKYLHSGFSAYEPFKRYSSDFDWKIIRAHIRYVPDSNARAIWTGPDHFSSIFFLEASRTFVLRFADTATFKIDFDRRQIHIYPFSDAVSDDTINHLVVDQVWPCVLAHSGSLVLHAAGVLTPAGAILLSGPSGVGKSTLAASFHRKGMRLLGDDASMVSNVDGIAHCKAVYPSLRLFPDSIANLFDEPVGQSPVADYTTKRNVDVRSDVDNVVHWHSLRAVFFLQPDITATEVRVTPLGAADSCMRLIEHSFSLDPLNVDFSRNKLRGASSIAGSTPFYLLNYRRDFSDLWQLHTSILNVLA